MRIWTVDPDRAALLCRQHLLGQHVEMHKLAGHVLAGRRLAGTEYTRKGLIDTRLIRDAHDTAVHEMARRGYRHASPMPDLPDLAPDGRIDEDANHQELRRRCAACRGREE